MSGIAAKRIVFPARPDRRLRPEDFRLEHETIAAPAAGEAIVATRLLAIDPGVVLRLTGRAPFAPPYRLGDVIPGYGTGIVLQSRHTDFSPGDTVVGALGWQDHARVDGALLEPWPHADLPEAVALTALGVPGLTGYFGIALGQAKAGDTVVISSAAGSVGMYAAQIARLRGARVVGVAGGPEKCRWLTSALGLDAAIDYKAEPDLAEALRRACPAGVDMYLDLVGGDLLNAAIAVANPGARFVLCGALSEFDAQPGMQHGLRHLTWVIQKNLRLEGFTLMRFAADFPAARAELAGWYRAGDLRTREDYFDGIESAPGAFVGLLRGQGAGRRIVRMAG